MILAYHIKNAGVKEQERIDTVDVGLCPTYIQFFNPTTFFGTNFYPVCVCGGQPSQIYSPNGKSTCIGHLSGVNFKP